MKRALIPILSLSICLSVFWQWTDGFSAFTVFSYTLNKAGEMPRAFPSLKIITQDSAIVDLEEVPKFKLLNFVYLNCPYACHKINNRIGEIYPFFNDSSKKEVEVEFYTLSFDLERDHLQKIKNYRSLYGDEIEHWTFALPFQFTNQEFQRLLKEIGIWAYKAPENGMINHSLYLYLISPENKIIKIFDPTREKNGYIIQEIRRCLKSVKA